MLWPWLLCGILTIALVVVIVKNRLLKKSIEEIYTDFERIISEDTNVQISISSGDKDIKRLAEAINLQLSELRAIKQKYDNGNRELKDAITNISHDLRTPLTAINGYLDLLEQEEKSETVERYISQIKNRAEVLKNLTEELFRYSLVVASEELNMQEIDVVRILEECLLSYYAVMHEKGIEPQISLPNTSVIRLLDEEALNRVFSNILSNALKYSDGDLRVSMNDDGSITFSNTAHNLDAVMVNRLFDRFYTVEISRSSTGLGLSIAKILTERMGGKISATYQEGVLNIIIRL